MDKIATITKCNAIGSCLSNPSDYRSRMGSWHTPSEKAVAAHAMRALEEARAKDVAAHEANAPLIASNQAIRQQVEALMEHIGMPKKWSERDFKSRSRYPKMLSHDAGYLIDLRREVLVDDGFLAATSTYDTMRVRYQQFADQAEQAEDRAEKARKEEAERKTAERRANMEFAAILLRYGFGPEFDWPEVLEDLRKRDQRLDLAVAMQATRGNWSEGPYRVRDALGRFTIHNDEDKDIVRCVADGLVDFEDGRVFRDMEWNYGALFASVADQQLAADVQLAASKVSND